MSARLVARWLTLAADVVAAERTRLTELDAAIGDGDHGINLDRGFREIHVRLGGAMNEDASVATPPGGFVTDSGPDLLVLAGRTILSTVGGASGALYGRAFLRAGEKLNAEAQPEAATSTERAAAALRAAVDSIAALGRSAQGDKTMLDALVPALSELEAAAAAGVTLPAALARAVDAARGGAAATIPLLARRGRASYLGERSIGHEDPGAASSVLLLQALAVAAADD